MSIPLLLYFFWDGVARGNILLLHFLNFFTHDHIFGHLHLKAYLGLVETFLGPSGTTCETIEEKYFNFQN